MARPSAHNGTRSGPTRCLPPRRRRASRRWRRSAIVRARGTSTSRSRARRDCRSRSSNRCPSQSQARVTRRPSAPRSLGAERSTGVQVPFGIEDASASSSVDPSSMTSTWSGGHLGGNDDRAAGRRRRGCNASLRRSRSRRRADPRRLHGQSASRDCREPLRDVRIPPLRSTGGRDLVTQDTCAASGSASRDDRVTRPSKSARTASSRGLVMGNDFRDPPTSAAKNGIRLTTTRPRCCGILVLRRHDRQPATFEELADSPVSFEHRFDSVQKTLGHALSISSVEERPSMSRLPRPDEDVLTS